MRPRAVSTTGRYGARTKLVIRKGFWTSFNGSATNRSHTASDHPSFSSPVSTNESTSSVRGHNGGTVSLRSTGSANVTNRDSRTAGTEISSSPSQRRSALHCTRMLRTVRTRTASVLASYTARLWSSSPIFSVIFFGISVWVGALATSYG